jgi:hypothetical protein
VSRNSTFEAGAATANNYNPGASRIKFLFTGDASFPIRPCSQNVLKHWGWRDAAKSSGDAEQNEAAH